MANITVKREDELESNFGGSFKLLRHGLGLSSFGAQVLAMPPNADGYPVHSHDEDGQEEMYTALEGSGVLTADDEAVTLEPGTFVRVGAGQERKVVPGDDGLKLLVIGGVPGKVYEAGSFTEPQE